MSAANQQQTTPTEQLLSTVQVTHIVSILSILGGVIAVNYIYLLYFAQVLAISNNVFYLVIFDVAAVGGMSYYAVNMAVGLTGITLQTQPAIPTPATPLASESLSNAQVQAIGNAVEAYLAQKSAAIPTAPKAA